MTIIIELSEQETTDFAGIDRKSYAEIGNLRDIPSLMRAMSHLQEGRRDETSPHNETKPELIGNAGIEVPRPRERRAPKTSAEAALQRLSRERPDSPGFAVEGRRAFLPAIPQ